MTEAPAGTTGRVAETTLPPSTPAATGDGRHAPGEDLSAPAFRISLTIEHLLWLGLLVIAALTRFWDLGYRTQHHDESIHTTFSWDFATGEAPYVHNPLSHGPFLFHANALIYQLFGGTDATSRFLPALTGVVIVMTPWLLRHRAFLGRWGALATGVFLLFSPAFLYYTRFIRHDPYTALGALLMVVAVFRYLQSPHRKWIILAFVDVAFLLTNHEIAFAILLAFVIVLWTALVLTRLRMLIPVHLAAAALVFLLLAMNRLLEWEPLPEIPWQSGAPEMQRDYYSALLSHPLVIGFIVIGIAFIAGCAWAMRHAARRVAKNGGVIEPLLGDAPQGSVAKGVYDAWNDPIAVGLGALLCIWLYLAFFTTLFTNMTGIATGTYATNGTLLYWLGQHDVQRGEQPWFYFITEGVQYEWLVIFLGLTGLVALAARLVQRAVRRDFSHDLALLFRMLIAFWMVFMFVVLSWAGEKMPWLIMHIVLPAAVLSGTVVEDFAQGMRRWVHRRLSAHPGGSRPMAAPAALAATLVVLAGSFFLIAANLTWGGYGADLSATARSVPDASLNSWWQLLVPIGLSILAIAVVWAFRGLRPAIYGAVTGALTVMLLFQVHAGFRLSFLEGDVSIDTLIYNTVGPDAKQLALDVEATSELYLGDDSITVSNDGSTNWPHEWYFKDMPNHRFMTSVNTADPDLPMFIIGVPSEWDSRSSLPMEIPGYTSQTYVFRWHEPEALIYRNFALAPEIPVGRSALQSATQDTGVAAVLESIWSSLWSTTDPDQQQKLWRLLMYRELPGQMSEYRFKVYVDNDALPYYNEVRYGQ
ncbi:MAG TPA: flippase activity-associated protein Agl23 [Thermomicrobiales bacterium]|nr:flippase activity-associated protein Agl23 [Thermomicrobiales bacterium]